MAANGAEACEPEPRDARLERLLRKARALPDVPGVYLMKDAAGTVVYVGKALRLPDRVSSYFVPSADLGAKKQPMLAVVDDVDVIECESEWEALLTENRLIKDLKPPPKYNVRLKDGKSFPYLAVQWREDFPRVFVTRNPADPALEGGRVFGPFTNAASLREAVTHLQRVFKFRTCSLEIAAGDERNRLFRPCLLHAIDQCTAPCAEKVSREAYRADVERFVRFLGSKRSAMLRELRSEMEQASASLRFEQAAALRDQIRAIERLDERATRSDGYQPETEMGVIDLSAGCAALAAALGLEPPGPGPQPGGESEAQVGAGPVTHRGLRCLEAIDIAHLAGGQTVGSKVCFIDGRPFKDAYRRYRVRTVTNDDHSAIREVVSRRYREAGEGHELYPDVILIDGGLGQLHAALEAFDGLGVRPPMVISLAKKEELIYVQRRSEPLRLPRNHAGLRLCQAARDEAHRFAQSYHHVLRRKETLGE